MPLLGFGLFPNQSGTEQDPFLEQNTLGNHLLDLWNNRSISGDISMPDRSVSSRDVSDNHDTPILKH